MVKSVTVTYKRFEYLHDVPNSLHVALRKLSYGLNGHMWPTLKLHRDGWCESYYTGSVPRGVLADASYPRSIIQSYRYRGDLEALPRHVMIAFVNKQPIGWALTDVENHVSVYVANRGRSHGIAQRLTDMWMKQNVNFVKRKSIRNFTHNFDAEELIKHAMKKLGLRGRKSTTYKITHKIAND
jgi:hypothetical protein